MPCLNILLCCPRNRYLKNKKIRMIISYKKNIDKKVMFSIYMYGLSGFDYSVATFSKSYLTVTGIIMQSFKSI